MIFGIIILWLMSLTVTAGLMYNELAKLKTAPLKNQPKQDSVRDSIHPDSIFK